METGFALISSEKGIQVHPGPGEVNHQTLVSALLHRFGRDSLSQGEDPVRPGIVHRLDKSNSFLRCGHTSSPRVVTSGLMVVMKRDDAHVKMKQIFTDHKIHKVCKHSH